jgi:hypothetical protein
MSKYKPASRFHLYMFDNKITYQKLSEMSGYNVNTLKNWINGRTDFPRTAMLLFCNIFSKSMEELFSDT